MLMIPEAVVNAPFNGDKKTIKKKKQIHSQYFNKPVNRVISPGSLSWFSSLKLDSLE